MSVVTFRGAVAGISIVPLEASLGVEGKDRMTRPFRRMPATGVFAAMVLGAGALLTAGPAAADYGDDGVDMACAEVTDAGTDAGAAAALAASGLRVEGRDKPVGFECHPVNSPRDANFCATATAHNNAIAFGTPGPCS